MAVYESALDLIGNTPIVDISTLSPNPRVRILAKLEGQNPGGSVKDRAAKHMILDAEKDGILTPGSGQVILESSSGNTGIALAMICKMRGYHLKVVLPDNVSVERRQLLESWGAEIISNPGAEGSNGAMRRAQAHGRRAPRLVVPVPVRQPGQPQGALRGHRPRDLERRPRDHPLRRRPRHGGHAHGRRPVPQGAQPRRPDLGHRAAGGGDGRRAQEHRRGLHPAGVPRQRRLRPPRPPAHRAAPGVDRVDAPPHRGRRVRRHLVGRHPGRGR